MALRAGVQLELGPQRRAHAVVAETIETQGDHLALIDSQGGLAALFLVELVSAVWLILEAARKNGRLPAHGAGQSCCSSPRSENTLDRWIQPSHQDWAGSGIAESACLLPTFQVLEDLPVSLAQVTPYCAISISDDSVLLSSQHCVAGNPGSGWTPGMSFGLPLRPTEPP
jgi:hypothetical protein